MRVGLLLGAFRNNYCLNVYNWISHELALRNVGLVIFEGYSLENSTSENLSSNHLFRLISSQNLDGLIVLLNSLFYYNSEDILKSFLSQIKIPVVSIGSALDGVPSVTIDNSFGFEKIVNHLVSHGYRRFSMLSGPLSIPEALIRKKSFLETVRKNGFSVPDHFILESNYEYSSGYSNALKLVPYIKSGLIDTVVCANDETAFAAISCFKNNNLCVPEDVAVTGFDDISLSSCLSPPLTTVSQRLDIMSKTAVSALCDIIMGRKSMKTCFIDPELVIRNSCGCQIQSTKKCDSFFPFVSSCHLSGKLQSLRAEELFNELSNYLDEKRLNHCFIVRHENPVSFIDLTGIKSNIKSFVYFGYSNGSIIQNSKLYSSSNLLPSYILENIKEPLLVKPLFFDKTQFGFMLISASIEEADFINEIGLEICHHLEILHLSNERFYSEKRLAEAHESLMISNKRLNEMTVKENLNKLSTVRYLAQKMLQHRRSSTGEYVLIIVEIDNYNEINNKYGFNEGEFVISCVSKILSNSIRDDDFLSHQYCERYVILVKNIQNDPIKVIGNRFNKMLDEYNSSMCKPYVISFSWGSSYASINTNFDQVYQQAEHSLTESKRTRYIPKTSSS